MPAAGLHRGSAFRGVHRLVGLAAGSGAELWYHGDFHWPGVAIAADVITRYGGRAWQMRASDYRRAPRSGVGLGGDPVDAPWDPGLREAMCVGGHAVYEETVGDHLLADLREYGPCAARGYGIGASVDDDGAGSA